MSNSPNLLRLIFRIGLLLILLWFLFVAVKVGFWILLLIWLSGRN